MYNDSGKRETIDSVLKGKSKTIWIQSLSNEWGRLTQGNDRGVKFTDTIDFKHQVDFPRDKAPTYITFVLDYRHLKLEPYRVCVTV